MKRADQTERQEMREEILDAVEKQIADNEPPETKQTFERLTAQGTSRSEAMRLIGCVLATEIFEIVQKGRPFDRQRYVAGLNALPSLFSQGDEA